MKIHLHTGAHKTASTYMQSRLAEALPALNAAGIGYLPLVEFRETFTRHLTTPAYLEHRPTRLPELFFPHGGSDAPHGLVLSDENLIGGCDGFVKSGRLYREAPARLARLREILDGHDVTLFFSIRGYDSFIASAYCEAMRHSDKFTPFAEFCARIKLKRCRWPAILAGMIEALRPEKAVVWRYEDFRANAEAVIRMLAFDVALPREAKDERDSRPSFSQTAVDILEMVAERHGPQVAARLVNPVSRHLPKAKGFPPFDPWSEAERAELRRLYAEDCAALPVPLLAFPPEASAEPDRRAAARG